MSHEPKPLFPGSAKGLDEIAEALLKNDAPIGEQPVSVQARINPADYIRIPDTNVLIGKEEILQGESWYDTHEKLATQGLFMPSPELFMPYFTHVVNAASGKEMLYDGNGKPLSRAIVDDLYKYLTTDHRDGCWAWLDAQFVEQQGSLVLATQHKLVNGNLQGKQNALEAYVQENCYVNLQWNKQGLPTQKAQQQEYQQGENVYFWHPRNNSVARFFAGCVRAGLSCDDDPQDAYSALGVFPCAVGTTRKSE